MADQSFTCPEVFDVRTDTVARSSNVLASLDQVQLHQLRFAAESAKIQGLPTFRCPLCWKALGLRGGPGLGTVLHFAHPREPDHSCPYKTGRDSTPDEIAAMAYNGLKETDAHKTMKARVVDGLRREMWVDQESIVEERRYRASLPDKSWRQPDVRALWRGEDLVFEAQLATTFITVVAQRAAFYRKNGALLVWVFAKPPTADLRFTEKDIVFNNNCNMLVVSKETAEETVQQGRLVLEAWWPWAEDRLDGRESWRWHSAMVTLDDLTFDAAGRVYYEDHEAEVDSLRTQRQESMRLENLRRSGDSRVPPGESGVLFLESASHPGTSSVGAVPETAELHEALRQCVEAFDSDGIAPILLRFQAAGLITRLAGNGEAERTRHFAAALSAILSVRRRAPVGSRLHSLAAIEDWVWVDHRSYYLPFVNAIGVWRRKNLFGANDPRSPIIRHLDELRRQRRASDTADTSWKQDTSLYPILRIAFPDLQPALDRIEAASMRRG